VPLPVLFSTNTVTFPLATAIAAVSAVPIDRYISISEGEEVEVAGLLFLFRLSH
jgi:hypothetical protein